MNAADTAFILIATALGAVHDPARPCALLRRASCAARNVLSVFMHCFAIAALMCVLWLAVGYSIAFGARHCLVGRAGAGLPERGRRRQR